MDLDFLQLNDFISFYNTELGIKVKKTITKKIINFWPELEKEFSNKENVDFKHKHKHKKQPLLGIGYTSPYLKFIENDYYENISILSRKMTIDFIENSNTEDKNIISNLYRLPFKDSSIDKIIILHSLEFSNNQSRFLREIWRILKDNGKIIFIVPNRLSIWSKIHKTPFGHGHPYSPQQLEKLLLNSMFTLTRLDIDVFVPPIHINFFNKFLIFLHYIGKKIMSATGGFIFGGVLIAEARKEIYGMTPTGGEKGCFKETVSATNLFSDL